ncbi:MAG: hypothetical protein Q3999_06985 [Buchananella hordeovulneris]|nr:hypothetical protein [Buchananella hordeovulneris]
MNYLYGFPIHLKGLELEVRRRVHCGTSLSGYASLQVCYVVDTYHFKTPLGLVDTKDGSASIWHICECTQCLWHARDAACRALDFDRSRVAASQA